jgi:hypothetical protein
MVAALAALTLNGRFREAVIDRIEIPQRSSEMRWYYLAVSLVRPVRSWFSFVKLTRQELVGHDMDQCDRPRRAEPARSTTSPR